MDFFPDPAPKCGCQTLNMVGNIALLTFTIPLYTMAGSFDLQKASSFCEKYFAFLTCKSETFFVKVSITYSTLKED